MTGDVPVCRECGTAVVAIERDREEDPVRSTRERPFYRPGALWHVCENGHRVKVEEMRL